MGERSAQHSLFKLHYGLVMSITLRYLNNKSEAEEALNDTFLKMFNNLDKYDEQYQFSPWLSKIAVNCSIDAVRKRRNKIVFVDFTEVYIAHPKSNDNEDEHDGAIEILNILRELSPQYRAVFNLFVFEEYKHKEIAEKLSISIGTSKSNYARARKIVERKLIEGGYLKNVDANTFTSELTLLPNLKFGL